MSERVGGYEANFNEPVEKRLECPVCFSVCRDPYMLTCCGEKYCKSCLEVWFRKKGSESCPVCRGVRDGDIPLLVPEKKMKREIESLKVYCDKRDQGCEWVGELRDRLQHLFSTTGCDYYEVQCPNKCESAKGFTTMILRKDLDEHVNKHCDMRLVRCAYCDYVIRMKYYKNHTETCELYPIQCPNSCGQTEIIRQLVQIHRAVCPLEVIECSQGCNNRMIRRDMIHHENELCELRKINCEYCGDECIYRYYKEHEEVCEKFPMDCPNGCGELDIVRHTMEAHLKDICRLVLIECTLGCQEKIKRCLIDEHQRMTCKWRNVSCRYCRNILKCKDLPEHYEKCDNFPVDCPNFGCKRFSIPRKRLEAHRQECLFEIIECKYAKVGCTTRKDRRKVMKQHEKEWQKKHLELMTEAYEQLELMTEAYDQLSSSKSKLLKGSSPICQQEDISKLEQKEIQLRKTSLELERTISKLEEMVLKVADLERQLALKE